MFSYQPTTAATAVPAVATIDASTMKTNNSSSLAVVTTTVGMSAYETTLLNTNDSPPPDPNYIICGRGPRNYNHEGNLKFREIIDKHVESYKNSAKRFKTMLVDDLSKVLRDYFKLRFMEFKSGSWKELTTKEARHKISHRFRDLLRDNLRATESAVAKSATAKLKVAAATSIAAGGTSSVVESSINISCSSPDNSTTAAAANKNNNNKVMNKEAAEMLLFIATMDLSSIYNNSNINNATIAPMTTIDNNTNENYVNAHNSYKSQRSNDYYNTTNNNSQIDIVSSPGINPITPINILSSSQKASSAMPDSVPSNSWLSSTSFVSSLPQSNYAAKDDKFEELMVPNNYTSLSSEMNCYNINVNNTRNDVTVSVIPKTEPFKLHPHMLERTQSSDIMMVDEFNTGWKPNLISSKQDVLMMEYQRTFLTKREKI